VSEKQEEPNAHPVEGHEAGDAAAFDRAMLDLYRRSLAEEGYQATVYLRMLGEYGGLETARRLLRPAGAYAAGLTTLWELRRPDLTVEALVRRPRWAGLFTEAELAEAERRLDAFGWRESADGGDGR
jgi:hypothetical protein